MTNKISDGERLVKKVTWNSTGRNNKTSSKKLSSFAVGEILNFHFNTRNNKDFNFNVKRRWHWRDDTSSVPKTETTQTKVYTQFHVENYYNGKAHQFHLTYLVVSSLRDIFWFSHEEKRREWKDNRKSCAGERKGAKKFVESETNQAAFYGYLTRF